MPDAGTLPAATAGHGELSFSISPALTDGITNES